MMYMNLVDDEKKTRCVRMVVAGHGINGPDFYFCKLNVTELQIEYGMHYEYAVTHAGDNYLGGDMVAFCEDDPPKPLFTLFEWESASVFDHSDD